MTQYDNNNQGAIWGNKEKKTDNHPDFRGSAEVDGVEYWISAWKRKPGSSENAPSLSFRFTPKEDRPVSSPSPSEADPIDSSDIPF